MTEGAGTKEAADNFGAIRLFAASLVVFGHAYAMTGHEAPRWLGIEVHVFAVRIFFVVSGYLICGSWQRDPDALRYAARRALRIMPGLVVVVLASVLVLGPLVTRLPVGAYAAAGETRAYLWNLVLAPYFMLPGVFDDGRPFTAVNGALWSLPVEVAMYALLPLYAGRRVLLPLAVAGSLGAAFWFGVVRPEAIQPVVWWTSIPITLRFASDFVLGAAVRAWGLERLVSLPWAVLALACASLLAFHPWALKAASLLVIPYAVLAVALAPAPILAWVGRRDDVSYGIYLWGGPIQQMLIGVMGATAAPLLLAAVALPAAWAAGLISWRLVERRALGRKPVSTKFQGVVHM